MKTVSMSDIRPRKEEQVIKDNTSQRQSSVSCDKKSNFDEVETFRKKKKMIVKERLRPIPCESGCKTPILKHHK